MRVAAVLVALASLTSLPAFAECVAPAAVPVAPDGATASRDNMLSAHKIFLKYDADVREYTSCLERTGGNPIQQDAAVDRLKKVASQFNAELRVFRKRSGV